MQEYVYLMRAEGTLFFKIGKTKDLSTRLRAVQTGCPFWVSYEAYAVSSTAAAFEAQLHADYKSVRMAGEWFRLCEQKTNEVVQKMKDHSEVCDLEELWKWIDIMDFGA